MHIPIARWGEPYKSMEADKVVHFVTGEALAEVSRANAALVERDMRHAPAPGPRCAKSRSATCCRWRKKPANFTPTAELPLGDGTQTPDQFARMQSATTGLPEHMCRFNMTKNKFVLENMDKILDALTRGLDLDILSRGYGVEARGVPVSYQAQSPVLGLVLPSNSPGVHTLWLPIIPMQVGLVLKPGPQEPWTPYRMANAFIQAGMPKQAIAIYPGLGDIGAAVLNSCPRSLIFGGTATVEQYKGNPRVQAHGPGFSKILLGDDEVDNWEKYLDIMADSVFVNSGRGCINCSGIWVSRQRPEDRRGARRAARAGRAAAAGGPEVGAGRVHRAEPGRRRLECDRGRPQGSRRRTTRRRSTAPRLVKRERCDYLRPTVVYCDSPGQGDRQEGVHVPVRDGRRMPAGADAREDRADARLLGDHHDKKFQRDLADAVHIDRLNLGPIPTIALNWLQPHEGSIVDFLFRARAFQFDEKTIGI